MINYLHHIEIDKKKWDDCIENAAQQLPYALSWYLDIACESWDALVLNDYEAVMPLPFKKKLGLHFIYQPFFTQQLGIFGNCIAGEFTQKIPAHFRHIHTNLNFLNELLSSENWKINSEKNLVLKSTERISEANFSEHCRRNIKKSQRFGLRIATCKAKDLTDIFQTVKGKNISHLKPKNYKTLLHLISEMQKRGMADITGVYSNENELLGGAVFIRYKNRRIFYFSALSEKGKEKCAMYFLISEKILNENDADIIWDFEGSNDEGLARFYKGFGAKEENYYSLIRNTLPFPLHLLKNK